MKIKKISGLILGMLSIFAVASCDITKSNSNTMVLSTIETTNEITTNNDITTNQENNETIKEKYTVTFNSNGGSEIDPLINIEKGFKITKPLNPTKDETNTEKYTFKGWYKDSNFTDAFDFENDTIEANITLYAKWDITNKYIVTFDSNEGSIVESQTVYDNGKVTAPTDPTKNSSETTKYAFAGWYKDESFTQLFDFNLETVTSNIILYAKWDITDRISIIFDTNEGTNIQTQLIFPGEKAIKPTTNPTKDSNGGYSYTFDGWYKDSNFNEEFDFNEVIKETTTIYAKWTETINKYTVTFDSNGGSIINPITDINYGSKIDKPNNPTKDETNTEKYAFVGWYKDSSLSQEFDFTIDTIEDNLTLYAKWDVTNKYTVTFNVDGGSDVDSQIVLHGEKVTKPNTNPIKDSDELYTYAFAGWYKDSSLSQEFDFDNEIITSRTTIYAKWNKTEIHYTVTFNSMGGTTVDSLTDVTYGSKINIPTNPTKNASEGSKYIFSGWYIDESLTRQFNFSTDIITENTTLYAKWTLVNDSENIITNCKAYNEGAYVIFSVSSIDNFNNSKVYYSSDAVNYIEIDDELIRYDSSTNSARADILGLSAGSYVIKVFNGEQESFSDSLNVSEDDRSGYAHFNRTEGVGAYNNDGTLKNNAVIVYVTDATKNTVTATINGNTYTGIANILNNAKYDNYPVDIRIIGTIGAATWSKNTPAVSSYSTATTSTVKGLNGNYLQLQSYDENAIISGGFNTLDESVYTKLNGLTNKIKYDSSKKEFDSYYNMLDVKGAKNVTVEGVGSDAMIFQWGFNWKSDCKSIEIKNITFDDYTEDACSFEGSGSDSTLTSISSFTSTRYWIHNNTFNRGVNYWDVCSEQDKHDGDGATDFKRVAYATVSYNKYYNNHKTGLVGGGDSQMTAAITFHHNFYDQCQSRLPFARQANMHMYNNYYYASSGNNMQIYSGAYAFIENCYFKNVKKSFILSNEYFKTNDSSYQSGKTYYTKSNSTYIEASITSFASGTTYYEKRVPAVKSYNNTFDNCSNYSDATVVSNRTESVTNGNIFGANFDTDSLLFYYDSTNQKSDVSIMNNAADLPTLIPNVAGAGVLPNFNLGNFSEIDTNKEKYTITFNTNGGSSIQSQTVVEGSTISSVSTTKANYSFAGWYTDESLNNSFDVTTPITKNLTLYAKWTEKTTANNTFLTLNDFTVGTISSSTSVGSLTITPKTNKTAEIKTCTKTIDEQSISKYLYVGGMGSYLELSIQFSIEKAANITVYYAGTAGRYISLHNESESIKATTETTGSNNIVNYTFDNISAGNYAIASAGSSLDIYAIVINYI